MNDSACEKGRPETLRPLAAIEPFEVLTTDVLVVGSGAAGLTVALGCAPRQVTVLTAGSLGVEGSSAWAQGGVAAALGEDDAVAFHAADTVAAGAGLVNAKIAELLAEGAAEGIGRLLSLGARFDRRPDGELALGREAAHRRRRIVHARGDATGAEIMRVLTASARASATIRVVEEAVAVDLVLEAAANARAPRRVAGVVARQGDGARERTLVILAGAVVLATGGLGGAYLRTTNPPGVRGDGLALAARAGARLVDLEFVQFHPTALLVPGSSGGARMPLLTEALRGEGSTLVDGDGRRFLLEEHPDAELAPRDIVARAIWRVLAAGGAVFLDAREAVGERFPERFPTVFESCLAHGIDPRRERIPVSPAAHYHMGGVAVDDRGRSSLPGLRVVGEAASSGLHGANRLASNSLLEALVFGARVAADLRVRPAVVPIGSPEKAVAHRDRLWTAAPRVRVPRGGEDSPVLTEVRRLMWESVGLVRREAGLEAALQQLRALTREAGGPEGGTLAERNLVLVARLVAGAALERRESRGGHFREDFPDADPAWRCHLVLESAAATGEATGGEIAGEAAASFVFRRVPAVGPEAALEPTAAPRFHAAGLAGSRA